ncbi:MAG: glycosyltransferase family 4 protein [Planctomycetes bacterium]|nr:glycosyltransferase family 4 protein [Planctomycetota bacterium]
MNLLFVTQNLPRRFASCGVQRQWHLVEGLLSDFDVTVATYAHSEADYDDAKKLESLGAHVELVGFDKKRDGSDRFSNRLPGRCAELASQTDFEVLLIAKFWMGICIDPVLGASNRRPLVILDEVDVEWVREIRRAELMEDPGRRDTLLLEVRKMKDAELRFARAADLVLCVTPADESVLRTEIPEMKSLIVPVGQYPEYYEPNALVSKEPGSIVFVGHYAHNPNVDGILWFARDVLPKIRTRIPAAKLYALGGGPPPEVATLANDPQIVVPGWVDDIRDYLFRAEVSIAPLRFGSGIKGKITEAFFCRLPVVTTSIGAEGMGLAHESNALIADDAETFAGAVVELLCDAPKRARLANAGYEFAVERFDVRGIARSLSTKLKKWTGR